MPACHPVPSLDPSKLVCHARDALYWWHFAGACSGVICVVLCVGQTAVPLQA